MESLLGADTPVALGTGIGGGPNVLVDGRADWRPPAELLRPSWLDGTVGWAAVAAISSLLIFVQSFLLVKLVLLCAFGLMAVLRSVARGRLVVPLHVLCFFLVLIGLACIWVGIGLVQRGGYDEGELDAFRLYVVWNMVFLAAYAALMNGPSLEYLHKAFVVACVGIVVTNCAALIGLLVGSDMLGPAVRVEMNLFVGVGGGYVRLGSNNIGPLFFLVPYFITLSLLRRSPTAGLWSSRLSVVIGLAMAALSGRRALWVVVALTPLLIAGMASACRTWHLVKRRARAWTIAYLLGVTCLMAGVLIVRRPGPSDGAIQHLEDAFSKQDERSMQKPFLLSAFSSQPFVGSGFGGYAGYLRSELRPWTYELTYYRLLFNVGVIGVILLMMLLGGYWFWALRGFTRQREPDTQWFAILIGLAGLFIGAYSNPYFGSFDYLFMLGLLPYVTANVSRVGSRCGC